LKALDVERYLAARAAVVERALDRLFPPNRTRLREAIRYSLLAGGKRVRPVLVLTAGEIAGGQTRTLMPYACAVEMIHTYSLVHDDLPAMDDDDVRRGRPTSHRVFGEGLAILVGDALLTEAFRVMTSARGVPPARVLRAVGELATAAGEAGMVGGQALDLASEGARATLARVRGIHRLKTGALLCASVRIGAVGAGAGDGLLRRLTAYGRHLGLAFQIADDILDEVGGAEADGQTDRELDKVTYPGALGMAGALRAARREREAARAVLRALGRTADPLRGIVDFVVERAERAVEGTAGASKRAAGAPCA
jgi:geranylgeranyl diphosphate synthase type II